jgi:hypothetical protein
MTDLKKLREILDKSTPVVAWYAHEYDNTVRGPWNRWFKIDGPTEPEVQNGRVCRASAENDVKYAAMALTEFPRLLDCLGRAMSQLSNGCFNQYPFVNSIPEKYRDLARMNRDTLAEINSLLAGAGEK